MKKKTHTTGTEDGWLSYHNIDLQVKYFSDFVGIHTNYFIWTECFYIATNLVDRKFAQQQRFLFQN